MGAGRLEELERKRDDVGLTDEEANELGRMMAERAGEPYENADTRVHHDAGPHAWKTTDLGDPEGSPPQEPTRERTPHPVGATGPHFVPAKGGDSPEVGEPLSDELQGQADQADTR